MRLGHNVKYTGSMSRLPILVSECSRGIHLERRACQIGLNSAADSTVESDQVRTALESGLPSLDTADDGHLVLKAPDCLPSLLLSLTRPANLRTAFS